MLKLLVAQSEPLCSILVYINCNAVTLAIIVYTVNITPQARRLHVRENLLGKAGWSPAAMAAEA